MLRCTRLLSWGQERTTALQQTGCLFDQFVRAAAQRAGRILKGARRDVIVLLGGSCTRSTRQFSFRRNTRGWKKRRRAHHFGGRMATSSRKRLSAWIRSLPNSPNAHPMIHRRLSALQQSFLPKILLAGLPRRCAPCQRSPSKWRTARLRGLCLLWPCFRPAQRRADDDADHKPRSGRYFFASASRTCSVKFFSDLANMSVNALASMQVSQCESTGSAASKGRPRFW